MEESLNNNNDNNNNNNTMIKQKILIEISDITKIVSGKVGKDIEESFHKKNF